jgi:hypothetical protein
MEAKNLRIGNLILLDTGITPPQPHQIKGLDIHAIEEGNLKETITIEPIPLTEEWLLKFDFKKDASTYYLESESGQFIEYRDNIIYLGGEDSCTDGMTFQIKIKHVHQLQNLYFAVTGEELTL